MEEERRNTDQYKDQVLISHVLVKRNPQHNFVYMHLPFVGVRCGKGGGGGEQSLKATIMPVQHEVIFKLSLSNFPPFFGALVPFPVTIC